MSGQAQKFDTYLGIKKLPCGQKQWSIVPILPRLVYTVVYTGRYRRYRHGEWYSAWIFFLENTITLQFCHWTAGIYYAICAALESLLQYYRSAAES